MAISLKRDCIKYVRDRAQSGYEKDSACYICGETENLDFHHYHSMTPMLTKWLRATGNKQEDVLDWRDEFIEEHKEEIYTRTVTLCHTHHLKLHSIYGKDPSLATATKQERWANIQREKNGLV